MAHIVQSLSVEIILAFSAVVMLGLEAGGLKDRRVLAWFGALTCVLAGLSAATNWNQHFLSLFGGSFIMDNPAIYFKELVLAITAISLLISINFVSAEMSRPGEYYTMFMFVCLGMVLLASAGDLITIFLAIEMTSMPLYVLTACLKYNQRSSEAGLKFFILGALASAFYLFGASMTFGSLGTIYLQDIGPALMRNLTPQVPYIGLLCMIGAFAFKIAAAPFHMWAPDVYQGGPTPTTAFLSTGPKVAGVAVLMRVLLMGFTNQGAPTRMTQDWVLVISVLSLLSMTVGNLVAMHQTNIKRLMAYSGIAHMGYILLGLAAASVKGTAAVMFYLAIYTLSNLGAWGVVIVCVTASGSEDIADMAGLSRRSPWMAMIVMLAFLSLGGLPPLSGFIGKFFLFSAAWDANLSWLVLVGILNSVASLFYYMGVLRVLYWDPPTHEEPISIPGATQIALVIGLLASTVLGLWPWLLQKAFETASTFFTT